MILDYATIIGRAAWVRHMAKLIGTRPPYSSRQVLETVFPDIAVSGAELPRGITEMAVAEQGRRALFYNRKVAHPSQRVGLMHGLYHHLSDIKSEVGLRECNIYLRSLATRGTISRDPIEVACDIFAAEVLIPLDVLDEMSPDNIFPRDPKLRAAVDDEIDHLASRFNVPVGFMRWRLFDLVYVRKTHFNL